MDSSEEVLRLRPAINLRRQGRRDEPAGTRMFWRSGYKPRGRIEALLGGKTSQSFSGQSPQSQLVGTEKI